MTKTDIAGLKIDSIAKTELLNVIKQRFGASQQTWLTTPYSEFLLAALRNPEVMRLLNGADIAVPDGIGIFWAKRYLCIPLTAKSYWGKILQATWQIKYTLWSILFYPPFVRASFAEKISGADLIWDLAKFAADESLSVYLLGGFGDTAAQVKKRLISKYPNILISGVSNKNPDDLTTIDDIKKAAPDLLLVAYGPIRQERWIAANLKNLPLKLAIGLGGTFDYLAGKRLAPPQFLRRIGLEWLWRLITQPYRIKRIFNATLGLIIALLRYKVFSSLPYRKNVVSILINRDKKILVALRSLRDKLLRDVGETDLVKMENYWQFPQGGIEEKENITDGAKREVFEELGIKNLELLGISEKTHSYDWHGAKRPLFFNFYKFRGQKQNIVYFKFTGTDSKIKIDNYEFSKFKWVNINELAASVHSEREALAKIVQNDLNEMAEKGII